MVEASPRAARMEADRNPVRLKVKCVERTCRDYGREQLIDVGLVQILLDETGRKVKCPSCHALMKIIVPSASGLKGVNKPHGRSSA
jgi:hypothetical protein